MHLRRDEPRAGACQRGGRVLEAHRRRSLVDAELTRWRGSFDEARDRIYSVPPGEFVAERSKLAQGLRAAGEPSIAAEVQKLRRPSVAAWSVDQAARADPHRVTQLFDAGAALGRAHRAATSGGAGTDVRDAGRRRRALVDELTDRAMRFAAALSPNPEVHRDAVDATWEAASVDTSVQATVAAGWLVKELPRPSGFELGASEAGGSGTRPTPRSAGSRARPAPTRDELALRRAQAALIEAREALNTADDAVSRADEELTASRNAAADAARRVSDLEATLDTARADARRAREEKAAEQAKSRAEAARARTARTVEKSARTVADREQ